MNKDDSIYIEHILESLTKIVEYTKGLNEFEFMKNSLVQDAVIRQFEIIGEATKNISSTLKEKNPGISWKQMAGMRDKLIHDYIGVDLSSVWESVCADVPELKLLISNIQL